MFGDQAVGFPSATKTTYVFGSNGVAINFTSIGLTGPNAASFVTTNTCGTTLAVSGVCHIDVRFAPVATGAAMAFITLVDSATGSPQSIALSGTGITPGTTSVSLSSSSLMFGSETVGSSTATQNVTVTNTGSAVLYFKSIALTGANANSFVTSNTCAGSVAAGATCRIGVRFVPVATGAASASLTLTDNASSPSQTIALTGSGQ